MSGDTHRILNRVHTRIKPRRYVDCLSSPVRIHMWDGPRYRSLFLHSEKFSGVDHPHRWSGSVTKDPLREKSQWVVHIGYRPTDTVISRDPVSTLGVSDLPVKRVVPTRTEQIDGRSYPSFPWF